MTTLMIGSKLWYHPSEKDLSGAGCMYSNDASYLDATVVSVSSDGKVNLSIFDKFGNQFARLDVSIGEVDGGGFAIWPVASEPTLVDTPAQVNAAPVATVDPSVTGDSQAAAVEPAGTDHSTVGAP